MLAMNGVADMQFINSHGKTIETYNTHTHTKASRWMDHPWQILVNEMRTLRETWPGLALPTEKSQMKAEKCHCK